MAPALPSEAPRRPDLLLAAIGVTMSGALLVAQLFAVTIATALAVGSIPAAGGVGYALFVSPPGEEHG